MTHAGHLLTEKTLSFIESRTGIHMPETGYRQVESFLEERVTLLGVSLNKYLELLDSAPDERHAFLDAITINETYFFREERHFDVLEKEIFPALKQQGVKRPGMWSAACSTGEEAISLAVLARQFWGSKDCTVLATDINRSAVERLHSGVYRKSSFRHDGEKYHQLLTPYADEQGTRVQISPSLLDSVNSCWINLSDSEYAGVPRDLHVVFLRNMLIYVSFERRLEILARIAALLVEGGFLFLSSTEIPLLKHPDMELKLSKGCYYFQKKTGVVHIKQHSGNGLKTDQPEIVLPSPKQKQPEPVPLRIMEILKRIGETSAAEGRAVSVDPAGDALAEAAVVLLHAVELLNSGDFERGEAALEKLESLTGPNEISTYLLGVSAQRQDNSKEALHLFSASSAGNADFWPALFQHAMLLRQEDPKRASREFAAVLRLVKKYRERGDGSYNFLLEGFDSQYFAGICEGWINRLGSKRSI